MEVEFVACGRRPNVPSCLKLSILIFLDELLKSADRCSLCIYFLHLKLRGLSQLPDQSTHPTNLLVQNCPYIIILMLKYDMHFDTCTGIS